ncbi:MAG TPA: acylase [Caulobacteraceae bacterium]|nr:acylase [Caulobacteraceae bacterium]
MRLARRAARGVGAVGALFAVVLGVFILADLAAQPPAPDIQPLVARAKAFRVRIRRDDFGVPHILGATDPDVAFGIGYAHSEDDFATIQDAALGTRGTLAGWEGRDGATTDYLVRLMRVNGTVAAGYGRLPADLRAVLEAYADGVNYYAARHLSKVAPGLLPLTGADVAAGFVFKTPFFYGLDDTLKTLIAPTHGKPMDPIGSNGVAVAPSRSADGATRLLVNSHQPYAGPVAWYEAVLQSGQGWHVAGGFFPGTPFMLHGHNAHLGWANTVNDPKLVDIYRLTINPANADQYRLDGHWRNFDRADAAIRVKLWGPLFWTVHKPVLWAAQGPVLATDHGVFAFRWAGIGETRQALQYYRLNKAANLAEWKAAMALQALPSINYIYADEAGNIGYVYNGLFPDRDPRLDWKGILPGDRSDLIWRHYLPFDRVPQIWNPKSGFVFNSNNTPFQATGPGDALKPADFPATMGLQTNMTNRAYRAEETFGADTCITAAAFRAYKFDLAYSPRSDMAKVVAAVLALDPRGDRDIAAAQTLLAAWDRRTNIASRGAALAVLTAVPLADALEAGRLPDVRAPLLAAIRTLKTHFGRIDPRWGEVNRIIRGKFDLPIDGGPDTFRAVYGRPQPDGRLKAEAGDTLIMFVAWDRAGKLSSQSIHQFGSATLDKSSPHYADQTPLFAAMKTKPVLFTEDELAGHIEEDYAPGERGKRR